MWALGVAIAVGIISLWRLKYSVAAIILVLPSYLLRTTIAGIPTTALELSIYAVALAAMIDFFRRRPDFSWLRLPKTWWIFFGLWTVAWVMATLFATDRQAALGAFKAWWFDVHLFVALTFYTVRTAQSRLLILKAAIISGVIVAVGGFVQLIAFRSTLQDGRLSSFFHPVANYASMYLGPIFVLGLGVVLWKVFRGWLWWAAVLVIAVGLVLTVSFAAYLAVAAGAIMIWLWSPSGPWKRRLGWATVALAIVGAAIIPSTPYFREHFNSTNRSSALVRSQIWVTSWALIKQHPIVGIGPNTFEANYRAEIPKHYFPPLEWLVAQPHNLYLALWLETGLLGLVTLIGFLIWWMRATWQRIKLASAEDRAIGLACLAAVIAILVHGIFDTPYFKNDLAIEWALLIVLPWLATPNSVDR